MEGLLSVLFYAALIYLMIRFGCGAHMFRKTKKSTDDDASKHIDPVCGKDVPPNEGYGEMHAGQLHRFCSRQCLDAFDADPDRYAPKLLETKQ